AGHRPGEAAPAVRRAIDLADIGGQQQRADLAAVGGAAHAHAESVASDHLVEDGRISGCGKDAQPGAVVLEAAENDVERRRGSVARGGVRALAARRYAVHEVRDDAAIEAVLEPRISGGGGEDVAAADASARGSGV